VFCLDNSKGTFKAKVKSKNNKESPCLNHSAKQMHLTELITNSKALGSAV